VCFFQHGLTGDATQPADVFSTQANFTLRTLACRGHSASELGPVDALSIPTLAQDVIAAIEQTGGAPVGRWFWVGSRWARRLRCASPCSGRIWCALVVARHSSPGLAQCAPTNLAPYREVGALLTPQAPAGQTNRAVSSDCPAPAETAALLTARTSAWRRSPRSAARRW